MTTHPEPPDSPAVVSRPVVLPELPQTDYCGLVCDGGQYHPDWTSHQDGFDAEDMQDYATAAVLADRAEQSKEIEQLQACIEVMVGENERWAEQANRCDDLIDKNLESARVLRVAEKALNAHVQWHENYDDYGGWPESDLNLQTEGALVAIRAHLGEKE